MARLRAAPGRIFNNRTAETMHSAAGISGYTSVA